MNIPDNISLQVVQVHVCCIRKSTHEPWYNCVGNGNITREQHKNKMHGLYC